MRTFCIVCLLVIMLIVYMGIDPVSTAHNTANAVAAQVDRKLHPTDCGKAPGAVSLADRIAWDLCISAQSADQDAKTGR